MAGMILRSNISSERLRVCPWRDTIVNNNIVTFLRRKFVPKRVRAAIRYLWTMKKKTNAFSEVSLTHVEELFDNDLKQLGKKLGLELNCQNFKDVVISQKNINWIV